MNKQFLITIAVALVIGAAGFFAGMKYQQARGRAAFANFGTGGNTRFGNGNANNARPVRGQILSIGDTSITVKMADGSSKVVVFSDSTNISQATKAAKTDLKTGDEILVLGNNNSDGSVTANSISINPALPGVSPAPTQ